MKTFWLTRELIENAPSVEELGGVFFVEKSCSAALGVLALIFYIVGLPTMAIYLQMAMISLILWAIISLISWLLLKPKSFLMSLLFSVALPLSFIIDVASLPFVVACNLFSYVKSKVNATKFDDKSDQEKLLITENQERERSYKPLSYR